MRFSKLFIALYVNLYLQYKITNIILYAIMHAYTVKVLLNISLNASKKNNNIALYIIASYCIVNIISIGRFDSITSKGTKRLKWITMG